MRLFRSFSTAFKFDEHGGTTVFGLFMTFTFLVLGGIAIDTQRLTADLTKFQVAADTTAHAAVYYRQKFDETAAIAKALHVGRGTIAEASDPNAIRAEDIVFGTWDGSVFTPEAGATQAVKVTTGQTATRGHGVATFLLRLSGVSEVDLEASAIYATDGPGGCIYALDDAGAGVLLSGGTSIDAAKCAIKSNATVAASCGTMIKTAGVTYQGAVNDCEWAENVIDGEGNKAPRNEAHTNDPLADNAQISALHARFADMQLAAWPEAVSVSAGTDLYFGWSDLPADQLQVLTDYGCNIDHPINTANWTVTCSATEINLGSLTVGGGAQVDFNSTSGPDMAYNFSGTISNSYGGVLEMGSGIYKIAGGVTGQNISFGSGSFHIGKGDCGYSICDYGNMIFSGQGSFILDGGVTAGGGATLKLGDGADGNSYVIGAGANGVAINIDGGAWLEFGDTTGVTDGFRVAGSVAGGGGSCVVLPAATNHDISDDVVLWGAAILGKGTYHIDGIFRAGAGGAQCGSNALAVSGEDVTVVLSGRGSIKGDVSWGCNSTSFCIDGGNAVTLTAPTSGENEGMGIIGPLDDSRGGVHIAAGGASRLSGVMYFPHAPLKIDGGGSLTGTAPTDCLQIIASEVTMYGGAATATECVSLPGSGRMAMVY